MKPVVATLALVAAVTANAQVVLEPELSDRLINLPTHLTLGPYTIGIVFTHRFSETVNNGGWNDLGGLDSAADIGLGVQAGLGKTWEAELYRSSFFKELEGAVKWTALRQGTSCPVGFAVRAGADYRAASGVQNRWSGFAQVVIARRVGSFDLSLVPMYASDTPTLKNAVNVGAGLSWHFPHSLDIEAEVIPRNRDARGGETAWAVALNKRLRGHAFLLYIGNSRATTADLLAGSDIPGGFKAGDVRLGFNLIRRFPE
ncbi:MAG: DUF5777 family beta-barrel protein [Acidobacteriota bacterium]